MSRPAEVYEVVKFIESNFDLTRFSFKNINYWPLIRNEIGLKLFYVQQGTGNWEQAYRKKNIPDLVKTIYRKIKLQRKKRRFTATLPILKSKIVACTYPNSLFVDTYENKKYCRYIDPYYELLKKELPEMSYIGFSQGSAKAPDTFHPVQFINLNDFIEYEELKHYLDSYDRNYKKELDALLQAFEEANNLVEKKYQIRPFYKSVTERILYVARYKEYFDELFKKSNLRFIFIEDYHIHLQMAMCIAAKQHNIRVIEIQHGILDTRYYPFVNKSINYEIVPDYIWCWSEHDKKILMNENPGFRHLIPFVGGNFWLRKFVTGEIGISNFEQETRLESLKEKYTKIILITLQSGFLLTENLVDAIRFSSSEYYFLVRFHPLNTTEDEKTKINQKLSQFQNTDTEMASSANLYFLFGKCDWHVTHSSASGIEALTFKIPTIVTSDNGYDFYKDYIEDGVIFFAKSGKEIADQLRKMPVEKNEKIDQYLISLEEKVAMDYITDLIANE